MVERETSPPVCVQILSMIGLACFGLFCIVKGVSYGLFSWWYILGGSCLVAAGFAAFRVYEVCVIAAQREMVEGQPCGPGP